MNRRVAALAAALSLVAVPSAAATDPHPVILTNTFGKDAAPGTVGQVYKNALWVAPADMSPRYSPQNVYVKDGSLRIRSGKVGGYVAFDPNRTGNQYGRVKIKWRVTGTGTGQGLAFLWWPNSDVWSEGEIDHVEGYFGGRKPKAFAAHHSMIPGRENEALIKHTGYNTRSGWHISEVHWTPRSVTYFSDGRWLMGTRENVPQTPHRYTIQVAGGPDAQGISEVEIAYIEIRSNR